MAFIIDILHGLSETRGSLNLTLYPPPVVKTMIPRMFLRLRLDSM